MKRILYTAVLVSFFMATAILSNVAASENEQHYPTGSQGVATSSSPGMMMQQGAGINQAPCMAGPSSGSKSSMMGMMGDKGMDGMMGAGRSGMMGGEGMHSMMHGGQMGMMEQGMKHMFFLDRVEELGLSSEQVSKLKAIHVEGRKDNIRNAAEMKIARLELTELLAGDTWILKDAEPLVRKVQKLEGDMQVRNLQAISDARNVLTAEQLKQAQTDGGAGNPENLFQ